MVTLTFLGTSAALPREGRFNVALAVRGEGTTLLVESGPGILQQLQRAGIDPCRVKYLFISHIHGDHALGFPMLILHRVHAPCVEPLEVICPDSIVASLRQLVATAYPGSTYEHLDEVCRFIPHPISHQYTTALEPGLTVATLPVIHAAPALALRLNYPHKSIVYSADTAPLPAMPEFAAGSNVLIHDANFSATLDPDVELQDHSTARAAGEIAEAAGVEMLALVHIHEKYAGRELLFEQEATSVFSGRVLVPHDLSTLVLT